MITPLDILSLETWILIISILVLARLYIHKKWQVLKNLGIPHETPTLLGMGNMKDMIKNPDSFFKKDLEYKKKFGYVFGSYMMLQPRISISDPEILKQIFIKEASKFRDRQKVFTKINGKEMNSAMTIASGDQWKRIRSTVSPTFSTSKMKEMIGIFDQCTNRMIEALHRKAEQEEGKFCTKDVFGNLSMDVICAAAFSTDVHSQDGEESELVRRSKELFNSKIFQNPLIFIFMIFPWAEKIAEKFDYSVFPSDLMNYYKRLTEMIIKNKKDPHYKSRFDIMQQMLKNEISQDDVKAGAVKGLTRTEIIGNSIIMIMGGYETTANTLIFFSYCLANAKQIQDKLREEIQEFVKKHNGLTYEGINDMKFLDMCMKETQRIYGAVPRNVRCADEDITIKGVHIPAGFHVDIPLYGMNHDEEYWDEPWEFKPERFEDMSKIDPIIFQPFGAGPRNCIAMRFAITEVKVAMCKLLLNFDIDLCKDTPEPPLETKIRGSLQPKEDIFLNVTPREDYSKENLSYKMQ